LGPEILGWVGLGFEKVTHDQLWFGLHTPITVKCSRRGC